MALCAENPQLSNVLPFKPGEGRGIQLCMFYEQRIRLLHLRCDPFLPDVAVTVDCAPSVK